ncbi:MAG TPA: molybdenum cofactor guanylyltransferase [Acidimicrobiia bacterium]
MIDGKWSHTGAVLAGGQSTRFGSPKHQLTLSNGATFLESVAGRLEQVCREVVVVGSAESDFRRIPDLRRGTGPLGGIEALLASGRDTEYLVCPVDMPLLTTGLLRRLATTQGSAVTILGIEGSDRMETLPVRIGSTALPMVRSALDDGHLDLHSLWAELGFAAVMVPSGEAPTLLNINTVGDYEKLRGLGLL